MVYDNTEDSPTIGFDRKLLKVYNTALLGNGVLPQTKNPRICTPESLDSST
jgi:hypothetical protein